MSFEERVDKEKKNVGPISEQEVPYPEDCLRRSSIREYAHQPLRGKRMDWHAQHRQVRVHCRHTRSHLHEIW